MRRRVDDVRRQYEETDPLNVRIETHRRYQERTVDLDAESEKLLGLCGDESLLDVGCGSGRFLLHLRRGGHHGRLAGLDQSPAMIEETTAAARDEGLVVEGLVGDAMALPFEDGAFDWVSGRHMLYHVPDVARVLREFARVASVGVMVSTNGRRNLPRICDLIDDLLGAFGHAPVQMPTERFCIENADEMFATAGLDAQATITANALIFRDVEPVVRYVMSSIPSFGVSDTCIMNDMERWVRVEARRRLNDLGGVWRDPTRVGLFVLTAPEQVRRTFR